MPRGSTRAGRLLREGFRGPGNRRARFHCYASQGKTGPRSNFARRASTRAPSARPKRSHEHRELATALSPGWRQQMRPRLPSITPREPRGYAQRPTLVPRRQRMNPVREPNRHGGDKSPSRSDSLSSGYRWFESSSLTEESANFQYLTTKRSQKRRSPRVCRQGLRDTGPDRLFRTFRLHRHRYIMQPPRPALCRSQEQAHTD